MKTHAASLLVGLPLIGSCLGSGPRFVAIDPEYAYVDGCSEVMLRGNGLGTSATAKIGDVDFVSLEPASENPDLPAHAQDVGFVYYGVTPGSPTGQSGFFDVSMKVDGKTLTLKDGFYYLACPAAIHVDVVEIDEAPSVGGSIGFAGCGLPADLTVRYLSDADGTIAATSAVTSTCGTARTTTTIPALADGTYWLELVGTDGSTWGGRCAGGEVVGGDPDTDADTDTSDTDGADSDSSDTAAAADTGGDPCASLVSFTLGGV